MRGRTWPHKAEHAVDMVTGAVVEPTLEPRSTNGSNGKAETKPLETY